MAPQLSTQYRGWVSLCYVSCGFHFVALCIYVTFVSYHWPQEGYPIFLTALTLFPLTLIPWWLTSKVHDGAALFLGIECVIMLVLLELCYFVAGMRIAHEEISHGELASQVALATLVYPATVGLGIAFHGLHLCRPERTHDIHTSEPNPAPVSIRQGNQSSDDDEDNLLNHSTQLSKVFEQQRLCSSKPRSYEGGACSDAIPWIQCVQRNHLKDNGINQNMKSSLAITNQNGKSQHSGFIAAVKEKPIDDERTATILQDHVYPVSNSPQTFDNSVHSTTVASQIGSSLTDRSSGHSLPSTANILDKDSCSLDTQAAIEVNSLPSNNLRAYPLRTTVPIQFFMRPALLELSFLGVMALSISCLVNSAANVAVLASLQAQSWICLIVLAIPYLTFVYCLSVILFSVQLKFYIWRTLVPTTSLFVYLWGVNIFLNHPDAFPWRIRSAALASSMTSAFIAVALCLMILKYIEAGGLARDYVLTFSLATFYFLYISPETEM